MECRTALAPGERCDAHPRATPLDLAAVEARGLAAHRVWGPPHVSVRKVAQVGGAGGGAGGLFESCEGCDASNLELSGEGAAALLVIIIAAFAAVALYYLIKYIVYAVRSYRERPRPAGSSWKPLRPRRALRGKVRSAVGTKAPFSGIACAAWGVVVQHERTTGGPFMLRDGATAGMEIELDDGRVMSIPAGRVRVDGNGSKENVTEAYLRGIDPSYVANEERPVIPVDEAREVRLALGEAVEIIGGLEERFDPNAPAGYRDAPGTMLVVAGTPTLVRIAS